mgnify:CR=1 FL=1
MTMKTGQSIKIISPGLENLYRKAIFIRYKKDKKALISFEDTVEETYAVISLSRILT